MLKPTPTSTHSPRGRWQLRDHCPRPPAKHRRIYEAPWLQRSSSGGWEDYPGHPWGVGHPWDGRNGIFTYIYNFITIQINHSCIEVNIQSSHGSYGLWEMVPFWGDILTFVHFQGVIYISVLGFVGDVFSKRAFFEYQKVRSIPPGCYQVPFIGRKENIFFSLGRKDFLKKSSKYSKKPQDFHPNHRPKSDPKLLSTRCNFKWHMAWPKAAEVVSPWENP